MGWDRSKASDPKYKTKEHRDHRARLVAQMQREGYLICTAVVCEYTDRTMTNPNGNAPDGLHLGHNDDGVTYAGPQHNACNVRDGARRARVRQDRPPRWPL